MNNSTYWAFIHWTLYNWNGCCVWVDITANSNLYLMAVVGNVSRRIDKIEQNKAICCRVKHQYQQNCWPQRYIQANSDHKNNPNIYNVPQLKDILK